MMNLKKVATLVVGYPGDELEVIPRGDIIGVDYGAYIALKQGLDVKYAIGDFDTVGKEAKAIVKMLAKNVISLSQIKDETDTYQAFMLALKEGYQILHIYHSLGGRIDHTIANLKNFTLFSLKGIKLYLYGENYKGEIFLPGEYELNKKNYFLPYSSFFALENIDDLTIQEAKYSIEKKELKILDTYAISNEFLASKMKISFTNGVLLYLNTRDS